VNYREGHIPTVFKAAPEAGLIPTVIQVTDDSDRVRWLLFQTNPKLDENQTRARQAFHSHPLVRARYLFELARIVNRKARLDGFKTF
jgi:hypothetical protein